MGLQVGLCWHVPVILALGRQWQADNGEFEASLVYRTSSKIVRAVTQRNLVSERDRDR